MFNSTSGVACDTSADLMDVCSNSSQVLFNYTTCAQKMAFSGEIVMSNIYNVFFCMA